MNSQFGYMFYYSVFFKAIWLLDFFLPSLLRMGIDKTDSTYWCDSLSIPVFNVLLLLGGGKRQASAGFKCQYNCFIIPESEHNVGKKAFTWLRYTKAPLFFLRKNLLSLPVWRWCYYNIEYLPSVTDVPLGWESVPLVRRVLNMFLEFNVAWKDISTYCCCFHPYLFIHIYSSFYRYYI